MSGQKSLESRILLRVLSEMLLLAAIVLVPARARVVADADGLLCELLPTKTSLVLCEPLVVDLRLTNSSGGDVFVSRTGGIGPGHVGGTYSAPDGSTGRCVRPLREFTEDKRTRLARGESFYSRLFLVCSDAQDSRRQARFVFGQAGTYSIRASIRVYEAQEGGKVFRIESAPIEVTAIEAKGEDRDALLLYRAGLKGVSLGLMAGAGMPDLGVKENEDLERLINDYPDSIYAQYVVYRQALFILSHYGPVIALADAKTPTELKQHFDRLVTLAENHREFPALDEVLAHLARCYEVAGERGRAADLRAEALRLFPESAVSAQWRSEGRVRPRNVSAIVRN